MFVKAIRFKDVELGDVVCWGAKLVFVERLGPATHNGNNVIELYGKDYKYFFGRPDDIVGLVHRPDRSGRSLEQLRTPIIFQMSQVMAATAPWDETAFNRSVDALREANEAYELGKPFDVAQCKPPEEEPRPNESLMDKHLTW